MWRNTFERFKQFYTPEDGGAGGGAPAGDPGGAVASPPTPGAGAIPASGAAGAGTGQPAGGAGDGTGRPFQYAEDRSQWVPPHRLRETSQRVDQLERALTNYQSRVRVLMGVAEPEDPRQAELKNAMKQMFPGLAPFIDNPKLHEQLANGQFPGRESIDGFQSSYWNRHALETVNEAVNEYAKAAGVEPSKLGERATANMARQLQAFIGNDPERRAAYESRDPSFMRAFIGDLTGFFVNPFRQAASVQGAQRVEVNRGLPTTRGASGVPSTAAGGGAAKPTGKALHEAARQALMAATGQ